MKAYVATINLCGVNVKIMEFELIEACRVSNELIKLRVEEAGDIISISDLTDLVKLFLDYDFRAK